VPISEVSAALGHSSQRTTLGIYSHAFVGGAAFSAGMARLLRKRPKKHQKGSQGQHMLKDADQAQA